MRLTWVVLGPPINMINQMKQILVLIFVIIGFVSCSNDHLQHTIISIPDLIENKHDLNLSDVFSDVSYIQLESQNNTYIKQINQIVLDGDFILVYDSDSKKLLQFNQSGEFQREFLKFGQGPNEFFQVSALDQNEDGEILILRNGQYIDIRYKNQELFKTIKLESTPYLARWLSNEIIVLFYPFPRYYYNDGYEIVFIDRTGRIKGKSLRHDIRGDRAGIGSSVIKSSMNNNEMYYWYRLSDTVYTITKDLQVYPRYVFQHDSRHIPYNDRIKNPSNSFTAGKKYRIDSYDEFNEYIFITIMYDKRLVRGIINKKLGLNGNCIKTYDRAKYKWIYQGLVNDIDGGLPFWPGKVNGNQGTLSVIDPLKLHETFNYNLDEPIYKDSLKHEILRTEIIPNINLYSNPIIVKAL